MTDKLKLFKVRLASGAVRVIVAPDFAAVAQLRFEREASGSIAASPDQIKGVEEDVDVDFVILREPVPQDAAPGETPEVQVSKPRSSPPFRVGDVCPECGGILHATLGQLVCSLGHQVAPVPEGAFHNHAGTAISTTCKACQADAPRDIAGDANANRLHMHETGCGVTRSHFVPIECQKTE